MRQDKAAGDDPADLDDETADAVLSLGTQPIADFADVAGTGLALALALHLRHGCRVHLVSIAPAEPGVPDWIPAYHAALIGAGVEPARIVTVTEVAQLSPVDVVANLRGFGMRRRLRWLEPVLAAGLRPGGAMLCDLRRGGGGVGFLGARGSCEPVAMREEAGQEITRVLFRSPGAAAKAVAPPAADAPRAPAGRFVTGNGIHGLDFAPGHDRLLLVAFDDETAVSGARPAGDPWSRPAFLQQGWSVLRVTATTAGWYRDYWVRAEFERLAREGFFARFGRAVFCGQSMGGHAAAVFSRACPGADVVALSPQSTLDRAEAPWETRFPSAARGDFSGKYGDAAVALRQARRATIFFDPLDRFDAAHAARLTGENVLPIPVPCLSALLDPRGPAAEMLTPALVKAVKGRVGRRELLQMMRGRRQVPAHAEALAARARDRGHARLAARVSLSGVRRGRPAADEAPGR